ncbi:MAG: radical SAM protein [Ignavibacteria bacterium]|nr:radical SAM protein [Ignavibacteria bacterium]
MPQAVAVWCKAEGHHVTYVCYTGFENLTEELPRDVDLVFIGAFTEAAQLAYALSNQLHSLGVITVLGGPHARCYPQDAQKYFDYVLGFTNKSVIRDVLQECTRHRPVGIHMTANQQPVNVPGVRERWEYIQLALRKAPLIKMVPMLASLGCPYTCSFCIDSTVPYQPLNLDVLKDDLRFLRTKYRRPIVGWHDPNFGVRFDDIMGMIEEAVPSGSIDFIAESSLSLLSEQHVKRMKQNGFKALLPGVESWYDLGNKSKTGQSQGMEKVRRVSDHVNMIMRYIPYVQTNFVLGLDGDEGPEPFELTKRFVDMTPGAFPGYSQLTAFGASSPLNLEYQRDNRVLAFPFHFLDNNGAMNIKPRNYEWHEFYGHVIDLTRYTFSKRAVLRRLRANGGIVPRWMNVIRALSTEGRGRIEYFTGVRQHLVDNHQFRAFFEQETSQLPSVYSKTVQEDLGSMWRWLPPGGLYHDPNVYLKSEIAKNSEKTGRRLVV